MASVRGFIERAGETWVKAQTHPFVEALGRGDLDRDAFKCYLVQDYIYLTAYCRALALACYKAPDIEIMGEMARLLESTLSHEMALHRSYAERFGISPHDLEGADPLPATLAYTSFMLDTATRGDFLDNLVCLLPCAIGYAEIGIRLKGESASGGENPYRDWIDTYAGTEFQEYAAWLTGAADTLLASVLCGGSRDAEPSKREEELFSIFLTSTRHEWLFWEMAYTREKWSV